MAALAIAASPFPVIPAVLLLFTARPRVTAAAFLGGWFAGVLVPTTLAVLLADVISLWDEAPSWVAIAKAVLGAVLIGYGVVGWLRRSASAEPPAWLSSLDSATAASAARLGLLLSAANPKILLLALAGGLAIADAVAVGIAQVAALAVFAGVGSVSVLLPLLAFLLLGERVLRPLRRVKDWLVANHAAVMSVVLVVLGAVVLRNGLVALP